MQEIVFDYKKVKKKEKKKSVLDEFLELEESVSLISSHRPESNVHKKTEEELAEESEQGDDWLATIANFRNPTIKGKRRSSRNSIFGLESGGKKKKKKKKDNEPIDYGVEFETEMALMRNLLADQNRFTDSLQKRYDALENAKSSVRGVGKFTTDLIASINQGRSTSMQILDKIISAKKTIADLNMKERKEHAGTLEEDDLKGYSANLLSKIITESRKELANYGDITPTEGNPDDILDNISGLLEEDNDRDDDVEKFLKYESRNVEIIAVVNEKTDDWKLEAVASDGETIYDYPLPEVTHLEINHSTGKAVDDYHTKYNIRWV